MVGLREIMYENNRNLEISKNDRSRRNRVLKQGFMSFRHQHSTINCVVRNISETGALLQVQQASILPEHFTLHVELDGFKVECEKVRQMGEKVAVNFVGEKLPFEKKREQVIRSSTDPYMLLRERETELKRIIANQRSRTYKEPAPQEEPVKAVDKHHNRKFGKKS